MMPPTDATDPLRSTALSTTKVRPNDRNNGLPPFSDVLPPLVFGTATFNTLYNTSVHDLPTTSLVQAALQQNIRAFDTSPFYGPSESLLGTALRDPSIQCSHPRSSYLLMTKTGRITATEFDYSACWTRKSVLRSLRRLGTSYLDLVYCHDIEFVSAEDVLVAVNELARMRSEGLLRYIGISGYPLNVLMATAHFIKAHSAHTIDAVLSYAHFSLQNSALADRNTLSSFRDAGVDVVLNASTLGMGLLRHGGVPVGAQGDWHPAPSELREAVKKAVNLCTAHGETIENIALRWSVERWLDVGREVGGRGYHDGVAVEDSEERQEESLRLLPRLGSSIIGVSNMAEMRQTMEVWQSIVNARSGKDASNHNTDVARRKNVEMMADNVRRLLTGWVGFEWPSPPVDFVNQRETIGGSTDEHCDDETGLNGVLT